MHYDIGIVRIYMQWNRGTGFIGSPSMFKSLIFKSRTAKNIYSILSYALNAYNVGKSKLRHRQLEPSISCVGLMPEIITLQI